MASDDLWILGIHMAKFGKHPDQDLVDLASEAVLGALADGGVTMKDMGIIGAGDLMAANAGIGQQVQKQLGQTGIPVFNVANACATGATWRDGTMPVNVSGGLESKGHPIAATGIANVWEVATHLRGEGGSRQIEGAKVGLAHVIGLGSACGVHILEKAA